MRIIVFFDLPVKTKVERRIATKFRKFLLDDGYAMMQYSIYTRVCNGQDTVAKHERRLNQNLPSKGAVRMLAVTEKQYFDMKILLGKPAKHDKPMQAQQISLF